MLSLLLAASLAVPMPSAGTYKYQLSVSGQTVGSTTITLKVSPSAIELDESASAQMGPQQLSGNSTLALDGALAPTAYTAAYQSAQGLVHAAIAFAGNTATETSDTGDRSFSLSADEKHFVVLDGTMFSGFLMLPAQLHAWNSAPVYAVVPMFGRGSPLAVDTALPPDRPAGIPRGDLSLAVSTPVALTIWYDPGSLVVDQLDVPSQEAVYSRIR